jgi:hypothetical protein
VGCVAFGRGVTGGEATVGAGLAVVGAVTGGAGCVGLGGGTSSGSGRSISTAVGAGSAVSVGAGVGAGAGSGLGAGEGAPAGAIVATGAGGCGPNRTFTTVIATITPASPPTAQPSSTNTGSENKPFDARDAAFRAFDGAVGTVAVPSPAPAIVIV